MSTEQAELKAGHPPAGKRNLNLGQRIEGYVMYNFPDVDPDVYVSVIHLY